MGGFFALLFGVVERSDAALLAIVDAGLRLEETDIRRMRDADRASDIVTLEIQTRAMEEARRRRSAEISPDASARRKRDECLSNTRRRC